MLLPRIKWASTASLYIFAEHSLKFFWRSRFEAIRSSSLKANVRFLSVASETRIRLCHFRSLYIWPLNFGEISFPKISRFFQSIIVLNPLSCIIYVIGAPVLVRFFFWSASKALHSGPLSIWFSEWTKPHSSHTNNPLFSSKKISLPHSVHKLISKFVRSLDPGIVSFQFEINRTFL